MQSNLTITKKEFGEDNVLLFLKLSDKEFALLDTGASVNFMPTDLLLKNGKDLEDIEFTTNGMNEESSCKKRGKVTFYLAGIPFYKETFYENDFGFIDDESIVGDGNRVTMILGSNFFMKNKAAIDYETLKLRIG